MTSKIFSPTDLNGKVACFPSFEGAAFLSVAESLHKLKLIKDNCSSSLADFFSDSSCFGDRRSSYCRKEFAGDRGAMRCLKGFGEVAFMNMETYRNLTGETLLKDDS